MPSRASGCCEVLHGQLEWTGQEKGPLVLVMALFLCKASDSGLAARRFGVLLIQRAARIVEDAAKKLANKGRNGTGERSPCPATLHFPLSWQ